MNRTKTEARFGRHTITPNTRQQNAVMIFMVGVVLLFIGAAYVDHKQDVQALWAEHDTLF